MKIMNKDIIEGNWNQVLGDIQKQWVKLTDEHLAQVMGSRKKLAGVIQKNYGLLQDEAEKQVTDWENKRKKFASDLFQRTSK
jgi:uncharacterized protein YjbJ (UPF0337 family)